MCRIAGRLGSVVVRLRGADGEIPVLMNEISNPLHEAGAGTMLGARFDWGGRLLNCNGGTQRFPQAVRKPAVECKRIRELDCKRDISSRNESWR